MPSTGASSILATEPAGWLLIGETRVIVASNANAGADTNVIATTARTAGNCDDMVHPDGMLKH